MAQGAPEEDLTSLPVSPSVGLFSFFLWSLLFACVAWKQKVPLYQLLGTQLTLCSGRTGVAAEMAGKGGRVGCGGGS